jgi:hypothetical protein
VEARARACFLATVRALPAFFVVARDADRFVATVRGLRVFFAVVRFPDGFFAARDGDFELDRFPLELPIRDALPAGLPDRACEELRGADRLELDPLDGVPFEPASRTSRTNSRPAATAPSIMLARSSCLTAMRALATARGTALCRNTLPFRLWRHPPVPGNLDEAATMTAAGPTLPALANLLIGLPL